MAATMASIPSATSSAAATKVAAAGQGAVLRTRAMMRTTGFMAGATRWSMQAPRWTEIQTSATSAMSAPMAMTT